jgi:hypothetical protein
MEGIYRELHRATILLVVGTSPTESIQPWSWHIKWKAFSAVDVIPAHTNTANRIQRISRSFMAQTRAGTLGRFSFPQ